MGQKRQLRICEFNIENLFISMDYYDGQDLSCMAEQDWRELALAQYQARQKPLAKVRGAAAAIRDIDPDVLMLIEVGGEESLLNFNEHFLNGCFDVFFVQGNSRRKIDLAFLVKKDIGLHARASSNRETPVKVNSLRGSYESRFSRDVAELRLSDSTGLKLIFLLVHLKSKLSTEGDFRGKDVRTAEAVALADLYSGLRARFPRIPIIVGGDFNAELSSLDLELIQRTDLTDFHDRLGTPPEDRISLVHFDHQQVPRFQVIDYILISPHLINRVVAGGSYTYRYKGFYDLPEPLPGTLRERFQLPSDHYPLVLTVELESA